MSRINLSTPSHASFTASNGVLLMSGVPSKVQFNGVEYPIGRPRDYEISLTLDSNGNFLAGGVFDGPDLVIHGKCNIAGTIYQGELLTAEVTRFSFYDYPGTADSCQIAMSVAGGLLTALAGFEVGAQLNASIALQFVSPNPVSFAGDWSAGTVLGTVGS